MNRQIYIHYGAKQFDPLLNFPIKNEHCWVKPKGGLWGSRINASFGWKVPSPSIGVPEKNSETAKTIALLSLL